MTDYINTDIFRHIMIMLQTAALCSGVSLISILFLSKKQASLRFGVSYTKFVRFYIPFFAFFLTNYVIFYSDYFIVIGYSEYLLIYYILSIVFDITLVYSLYHWIIFSNVHLAPTHRSLLRFVSVIYITLWLINYILSYFSDRVISDFIGPILTIVADALYLLIAVMVLLDGIKTYMTTLKYNVHQVYYILCSSAFIFYLAIMSLIDILIAHNSLKQSTVFYYELYFFDPIIAVFVLVSVLSIKYFYIETKEAAVREHDRVMKQLDSVAKSDHTKNDRDFNLTPRETEIFELILQGYSNPQIAEKLFISVSTVKRHVNSILKKTNCQSRYELIALSYAKE